MKIKIQGKAVKSQDGTDQWAILVGPTANSFLVCLLSDHSIHHIQAMDIMGLELCKGVELKFTPTHVIQ